MDIKDTRAEDVDQIYLAQDRIQQQANVNTIKSLRVQ
jgi:hypothetical protein